MSENRIKRGKGRPSKYNTIDIEQLQVLTEEGFTDKKLCKFFKITEPTLNTYKKTHPDFFKSLKTGKDKADQKVIKSLYERACGYSHPEEKIFCDKGEIIRAETIRHYPPDPTSMIFWLKNRKPDEWRDKHELEGKGFGAQETRIIIIHPPNQEKENGRKIRINT